MARVPLFFVFEMFHKKKRPPQPERVRDRSFLVRGVFSGVFYSSLRGPTARDLGRWLYLALHRALRQMAGQIFLLVFWALAGACQRHGAGGFC